MSLLASILLNQITPIFIAIGLGVIFGRAVQPETRSMSRAVFLIFTPALVISSLTSRNLALRELGQVALVAGIIVLANGLLAFVIARLLRFDRTQTVALTMVAMFANVGNMGLPLNLFAFGEPGQARAVAFYVTSTFIIFSLGVPIASSGKASIRQAIAGTLKVPIIYALLGTVLLLALNLQLPLPIQRPVDLLGQAAIPVMLILLGIQVGRAQRPENLRWVGLAIGLRLLAGPLIGFAIATAFGLSGVTLQAVVLQSGMPIAVFTTILALEYDTEPVLVTSAVILSNLLSPLTLTPLIALLS